MNRRTTTEGVGIWIILPVRPLLIVNVSHLGKYVSERECWGSTTACFLMLLIANQGQTSSAASRPDGGSELENAGRKAAIEALDFLL